MAGICRSLQKSVYVKFFLVIYILSLFLLAIQLLKLSGREVLIQVQDKTRIGEQGQNAHRRQNKTLTRESIDDLLLHDNRVISECPITAFPIQRFREETWQKVDPTDSMLVFSAYYEERNAGSIKIIGLSVKQAPKHFCQLWYRGYNDSKGIWMKVTSLSSERLHTSPHKYVSYFLRCSLPDSRIPFAVSVVPESGCTPAYNALKVTTIPVKPYTRNFTVCLTPLNFRYGRAYELVEWIELNLILGANKFVIYNYSSAVNVRSVLEHYSKLGIVDIVQWSLPISVDKWPRTKDPIEVHYFAQTSALNDCLLKIKSESEFVVNLDLDEFIIPHANNTFSWQDIIGGLPRSGAYIIRNSFFRKEWTEEKINFPEQNDAEKYKLVSLLKIEREARVWLTKQRSKYIARTSEVEIIVTHDISSMLNGQKPLTVDSNLALLHHYRNWLEYNDKKTRVVDKTVIDKYSKVLVERVASTWSKLKNVTMDIPIE